MTNTDRAKQIRGSLKSQHAYLNTGVGRTRIYDVVAKRDGTLSVKIIQHRPGQLGYGKVSWWIAQPQETITIFAATPMEETFSCEKGITI